MSPLRFSLLRCLKVLALLFVAICAKQLFAHDLKKTDLDRHARANAFLLDGSVVSDARRFEAAVAELSELSDTSLERLINRDANLGASEKLNALLLKESLQRVAERHGVELDFDNAASKHFVDFVNEQRRSGTKLGDRSRALALLQEELQGDADKTLIMRRFDASVDAQIRSLDDRIPTLFESAAFRVGNPVHETFLRKLSVEYFKRLPLAEKRLVLLDALTADPGAKSPELGFEILFKHAGPQYQKLLQIVAREEGLDPEFAKVLKKLESSVPEAPFAAIDADLRTRIPDDYPARVRILDEKPLGSGTLAQTYSALMKVEGGGEEPVALRVLRPGIAERIAQEKKIFEDITPLIENDPQLRGTPFSKFGMVWQRIAENVDEELHVELTVRNQRGFQSLFDERPYLAVASKGRHTDIRVPKVYRPELAEKGVMLQEFVNGKSFEKVALADRGVARKAAIDFATMWMREAMFLSGWHHSDPHQGNLRVAAADSARPQVYQLDYGMVGHLDETQRSDLILLGYALRMKDAKKAAHHAADLLSKKNGPVDMAIVERLAREEIVSTEASAPGLLERLVVAGQELPRELVSFNRGYFMINQLLRQTGSEESLFDLTARMGEALVGQDVLKRVVGWGRLPKGNLNPTPLTQGQLWRVTGREIRSACAKALASLVTR